MCKISLLYMDGINIYFTINFFHSNIPSYHVTAPFFFQNVAFSLHLISAFFNARY